MAGKERALLIFDGECAFCRLWVDHWRTLTEDRVQYASSREIAEKFPDVPRGKYARAVQLIDEDGARFEGAAAVFRLISKRPGFGWFTRLYDAPAAAPVAEWGYRLIARNRPFFLRLTRLLWGKKIETPRYRLAANVFLRVLSAIYFAAFLSLLPQLPGLVGASGLLPAETYFETLRAQHGAAAAWLAPSLAWFGAHAGALQFMAIIGAAAALLSFGGILIAPAFALMWALYLSLAVAGQGFFSFPWDALLLEAGFLAILLAVSGRGVWLYRFLLFRVLFSSGLMKLLSGEPAWRDMSALSMHFETQPLPTALAWFMHQLPQGLLKALTLLTLGIELLLPFFFFFPRRARQAAAIVTAVSQLAQLFTGNSAFFNWLVLALCLFLLDDAALKRLLPGLKKMATRVSSPGLTRRRIAAAIGILWVTLGATRLAAPFMRMPTPALLLTAAAAPLRISNDYGWFAVMAPSRPEIVIEGSVDGAEWKEYAFTWKPGDVKRSPGWIPLLYPRLDGQMRFAALGGPDAQPWVAHLMIRLLQGSKPVLALLEENPFPGAQPKFVRATLYAYRFSTPEERTRDGAWWRREMKAPYLPTLSLTGGTQ